MNMESVGAALKKIRLEKGITIEDAHKKTKIHIDVLKAIEDDTFVNLNPVYIKGFLKIYCKFLGVTPSDYISGYKEPQPPDAVKPEEKQSASYFKFFNKPFIWQKIIFGAVSAAVLILLIIGLIKLAGFFFSRGSSAGKKTKTDISAVSKQRQRTNLARTATKSPSKPNTQVRDRNYESAVSKDTQLGIMLGIHALDDCWIQLKSDGKTAFQNVLKKGRFESWQAKDKIELSIGSAGSVQLEVNGKLIPVLGRKGQVLRNITITKKDGLKVGK